MNHSIISLLNDLDFRRVLGYETTNLIRIMVVRVSVSDAVHEPGATDGERDLVVSVRDEATVRV